MSEIQTTTTTDRWLICEVASQHFALSVQHVVELIPLSNISIHRVPRSPKHIEGIIDLRGKPLAVADLRSVLGMNSMRDETEEIIQMLHTRESDHVKWIEELDASVHEGREFRLATDPHKCGFGKWFDALTGDKKALDKFTNGDLALLEVVERFDAPHQRIHSIAQKTTALTAAGKIKEAEAIINATRDTDLSVMVELFGKARDLIVRLRRGVIVVLEIGDARLGALVDTVSEVRRFAEEDCQQANLVTGSDSTLVASLIQDPNSERLIQVLDVRAIHERSTNTEDKRVAAAC